MTEPKNHHNASELLTKVFIGLVVFALVGTAVSTWFKVDSRDIAPFVTVLLIICGSAVAAIAIGDLVAVILLLVVCGGSEIIGVFTGLPFGHYEYTDRWWPTVWLAESHRFPLLIPFAWLLVVGGAYRLFRAKFSPWQAVPLSALLATLIDIPMERAMTWLFVYWRWEPSGPLFGAPVMNSVGWLLVSLSAGSILALRDRATDERNSSTVLGCFLLFVSLTGFIHRFEWAWVLLAILSVSVLAFSRNLSAQKS